ncbi:MAG: GGDEF domain-containing protein [Candidatus Nanopelagicales bacterium]
MQDPLTGALNRRGLQHSADLVHDLEIRRHLATSIVEIDLDGFKRFNDTNGHHAGDDLLAALVEDWSSVLRGTDILARTGGDEFVLVLPATSHAEAHCPPRDH